MGGFPRAHWYNYAIRSRGLWDLGNKDDGVCYGCNLKMVKWFLHQNPPFTISCNGAIQLLAAHERIA